MEKTRIEQKANEILNQYNIDAENGVDIVELCKRIGFSIFLINNMKETDDGFIIVNNDVDALPGFETNKIIAINAKRSYEEKRFIIAHELGHYVLRRQGQNIIASRENRHGRSSDENDVDFFAACVLMPKDSFVARYNEYKSAKEHFENVLDIAGRLAKHFGVPMRSAARRMEETELISMG